MKKMNIIQLLISLIAGLLFGAGMIISGMVNPQKVIGFLDITGNWDPSLAFVMMGALCVFTPGYHLIIKKRSNAVNGEKLPQPNTKKVDSTLISGAIIFGIGWGLSGVCPGPAVASIGGGSSMILVFVLSMLIGMFYAKQYLQGKLPVPFIGYRKNDCTI
ncbi:MAG: YeeE/YedE family protein [Psychromonas sp.]